MLVDVRLAPPTAEGFAVRMGSTRDIGLGHCPPVELAFTGDFPPDDFWSRHGRDVIAGLGDHDFFVGRKFREYGAGHGDKGLVALEYGATEYIAVEKYPERSKLLDWNTAALELWDRVTTITADAVEDILSTDPREFEDTVVYACLPQVPFDESETKSDADGFKPEDSWGNIGELLLDGDMTVQDHGLTLLAATLQALSHQVGQIDSSRTDVLIELSDRITDEVKGRLFALTGWEPVAAHPNAYPEPQDIDTSVAVFINGDDGQRFYDEHGTPMSAQEAERRRLVAQNQVAIGAISLQEAVTHGYPRHHVTVHHLRLKKTANM